MNCTTDKCCQGKRPCPTPDECTQDDIDIDFETAVWFVVGLVFFSAAIGLAAGVITSPEFFTK